METKILTEMTTEELLERYAQTREEEVKWEIVLRHSELVKRIALRFRDVFLSFTQLDDIINEGLITLADAVERYDVTKGSFANYASIRTRGMIMDIAKKQDWVATSVRRRVKNIQKATSEMTIELGREPSEQEIADRLDLTVQQYRSAIGIAFTREIVSLEKILENNYGNLPASDEHDDSAFSPESYLRRKELISVLTEAIKGLAENEQIVLSLYHEENLKRVEIAKVLGVSPVRVSQIHTKALHKLKEKMIKYIYG